MVQLESKMNIIVTYNSKVFHIMLETYFLMDFTSKIYCVNFK